MRVKRSRAYDERHTREVHADRVVRQQLSERPSGHSRAANGIGMGGCAEREGDRQLVGADRFGAVPVVAAAELATQPIVDDRPQLLHSVKHLPRRVAAFTAQRDACAVPRSRGLRR